jgi:hypothetical protein
MIISLRNVFALMESFSWMSVTEAVTAACGPYKKAVWSLVLLFSRIFRMARAAVQERRAVNTTTRTETGAAPQGT